MSTTASGGAIPKTTKDQLTKAVSDSIRMDFVASEMARADAEVRGMMETTHERMREVERLIEERKQRARAMQDMQAESGR